MPYTELTEKEKRVLLANSAIVNALAELLEIVFPDSFSDVMQGILEGIQRKISNTDTEEINRTIELMQNTLTGNKDEIVTFEMYCNNSNSNNKSSN